LGNSEKSEEARASVPQWLCHLCYSQQSFLLAGLYLPVSQNVTPLLLVMTVARSSQTQHLQYAIDLDILPNLGVAPIEMMTSVHSVQFDHSCK